MNEIKKVKSDDLVDFFTLQSMASTYASMAETYGVKNQEEIDPRMGNLYGAKWLNARERVWQDYDRADDDGVVMVEVDWT